VNGRRKGKSKTGGETPARMNLGDINVLYPVFFFVYTSFVLNSHFISNSDETGPSSPVWGTSQIT